MCFQAFGNLTCFTEAKAAGAKIFDVIERVPVIDSSDELGKDPSSATGDVVFDKVHFSYPSRSGAEVSRSAIFQHVVYTKLLLPVLKVFV